MGKKYYKHKLENLLNISKIVTINYFGADRSFSTLSEAHDFWEMVYAEKHDIICMANGEEIILKEGEAIFHKPLEAHSFHADEQNAPNVFVICFECKSSAIGFFDGKKIKLDDSAKRLIYQLIEEGKKTFELPYSDSKQEKMVLLPSPALGGQQIIKNYLEILFIHLMRCDSENEDSDSLFISGEELNERIAGLVIEYLRKHIKERITVSGICSSLHYNKSYIFREFKKATGTTVMNYFTLMKITEARIMLRETPMSVSAIAEALAFDSAGYFSKTFKRVTGHTPTEYRAMRKQ